MTNLDRVRPRTSTAPPTADLARDVQGKRALFSRIEAAPVAGAVTVECSRCGITTSLAPLQAVRALLPSVHLPVLRSRYPSLLRCPACRRVAWSRLALHL